LSFSSGRYCRLRIIVAVSANGGILCCSAPSSVTFSVDVPDTGGVSAGGGNFGGGGGIFSESELPVLDTLALGVFGGRGRICCIRGLTGGFCGDAPADRIICGGSPGFGNLPMSVIPTCFRGDAVNSLSSISTEDRKLTLFAV